MHLPWSSSDRWAPGVNVLTGTALTNDEAEKIKGISPIIGIIVAIIGNTVISVALNTQRYAHVQLEKERQAYHDQAEGQVRGYGSAPRGPRRTDRVSQDADEAYNHSSTSPGDSSDDETQSLLKSRHSDDSNSDSHSGSDSASQSSGRLMTKNYLQSPWWWLGMTLMIFGESGNFLAHVWSPSSIVAPLGIVALVANSLLAPLMLGEEFRSRDGFGVLIAIVGCLTIVLSAKGGEPRLDSEQIWDLITTREFEIYVCITLVLIGILMVVSWKYPGKSIFVDLGLMGLFGGYTAMSVKGVAALLSSSLWRIVTLPLAYLLVTVLVVTAVMQIRYINKALQTFTSTQVIPTQFVLFTLSVIVGSAVLWRDFESKTTGDAVMFISGCLLTFFGVWCITGGIHGTESTAPSISDENPADDQLRYTEYEQPAADTLAMDSHGSPDVRSTAQTPVLTLTHEDGTMSGPQTSDFSRVTREPWQGVDLLSIDSAIHTATAQRLSDPGLGHNPRKPRMHATTSTPMINTRLTSPHRSRPQLSARHTEASPEVNASALLRTPERDRLDSPSFMSGSLTRSALSYILPSPSPLTGTLSSSINAIVIDSMRSIETSVHADHRVLRSVRSHGQGVRHSAGLGVNEGLHSAVSSTPPAVTPTSAAGIRARSEGAPHSQHPPGRNVKRSVSHTIGGYLGLNRASGSSSQQGSAQSP